MKYILNKHIVEEGERKIKKNQQPLRGHLLVKNGKEELEGVNL